LTLMNTNYTICCAYVLIAVVAAGGRVRASSELLAGDSNQQQQRTRSISRQIYTGLARTIQRSVRQQTNIWSPVTAATDKLLQQRLSSTMYLSDEVQGMAQRVLAERGCPVRASNSSTGSSAADRRTWSSTSSNRSLSASSMSSSATYSRDACETNTEASEADVASFSLTNLKSAYLQAAANTPSISSGNSSSASSRGYGYSSAPAARRSATASAGNARAPAGGVSAEVAARCSNFLQAFKDDEKRLKEAAAEAAAAAAKEAAAETAAGGISVSSLRSGWLETQRQEAERAAEEAAIAASLTSGRSRAPAASNDQQLNPALGRFSCAGLAGNAGTTFPASAAAAAAAAAPGTGQRVLDKTHEVAQMAEKLLRSARVSNSGPCCAGVAAAAAAGVPVAAPLAYGDAVDLDM
jgi:hypothetical protein